MKRKFFSMLLMGAMTIASVGMFTSCKDYDDDINNLQKQIDGITAQKLQDQLTTLQGALTTAKTAADDAQKTADNAVTAAAQAAQAAKGAQGTADEANAAAVAAQKTADAAQALAAAAAKQETVTALEGAIANLQGIIDGKVSTADFEKYQGEVKDALDAAIKGVEAKIIAINQNLLTLDDVKKLLEDQPVASLSVIENLSGQVAALESFQAKTEALKTAAGLDDSWKKEVDDAIASLTAIKSDVENNKTEIATLKSKMQDAEGVLKTLNDLKISEKLDKLASIGDNINVLSVYMKRLLTSINLSPSKFYGGIEGVDIFAFTPNDENMWDKWHYFTTKGSVDLSEIGLADYHISPLNVDLTNFSVNFFSRTSGLVEPAGKEATRAAVDNSRVTAVYGNTNDFIDQKDKDGKNLYWNAKTGILTVPFTAKAAAIKSDLDKGTATITALQLSRADTTVTSDYALVYPTIIKDLLICDNSFDDADDVDSHQDNIGKDGGKASSFHLHRNFSFLALSTTAATHEIQYADSFDITKILETHYVEKTGLVKDTLLRDDHKATALNGGEDGDATIKAESCKLLNAERMKQLGLHYVINRVDYSLGTTSTSESAHIQLGEREVNGETHMFAFPRNIKPDGTTDVDKVANMSAVGRMPIVCIELRDKDDHTVSFAWMKFLISKSEEILKPETFAFSLNDFYADCKDAEGKITWNQVEYEIYQKLNMSKETFDFTYEYDFYKTTDDVDQSDKTTEIEKRYGEQFSTKDEKTFTKLASADRIGDVTEQWNKSEQNKEDATTHVLMWTLHEKDFFNLYWKLNEEDNLDRSGKDITNKRDVSTWVRYKRQKQAQGDENGDPAVFIKFTIPAGKLHFAKGKLEGTKTLTYWYNINSDINAETADKAKEVRVNVPVPVPGSSDITDTSNPNKLSNFNCPWNELLTVYQNNVLTREEFIKNLHDFFLGGKLNGKVNDASNFAKLSGSDIVPEFGFTLPSKSLGNANFDHKNGTWTVPSFTGKEYTLKLFKKDGAKATDPYTEIRIAPYEKVDILCSISKDDNDNYSIIKYHEGPKQDDILNAYSHDMLGEKETFTAYIQIVVKDACAPIEFDDMWFNVRFLRPLDLLDPNQGLLPDAPNDWQYVDIAKYLNVVDWREYVGDRTNSTGGKEVSSKKFDFNYYQIDFNVDDMNFKTDAHLGTKDRDASYQIGSMISINADKKYAAELVPVTDIKGLDLEKVGKTRIRYKNNSGVTGGFHIYVPVSMTYVFGSDPSLTQTKYVTLGVSPTVQQPQ